MSLAVADALLPPRRDPVVATAFRSLDEAGVRWCLLRGDADTTRPGDDVDLLVHPAHRQRAEAALARAGFAPDPRPGLGTHRFHVARGARGGWVKLDVVTDVAFGPARCWRPMTPEAVLARVVRHGPVPRPDADDAAWMLLAHGLLDRGRVSAERLAELHHLAALSTLVHPLAVALGRARPGGAGAEELRAAAGRGDRERLDAVAATAWPTLVARLPRRDRAEVFLRSLAQGVHRRLARTALLAPRGLTVALLAPDGAGKSTLAAVLLESWPFPVSVHYLGLYPADDPWLRRGPDWLRPLRRLVRTWGTVLRLARDRARGHLVVLDRHPCEARLDPTPGVKASVRRFVFGSVVPAPDVVVVLDAPPEVLADRKPEHTVPELAERRQRYLDLAGHTRGTHVVDTAVGLQAASEALLEVVWAAWRRRR